MPVLSQEIVEKRIFDNSNGRFQLISTYQGRKNKVKLHCLIHNIDFEVSGEAAARIHIRCNCPKCSEEQREKRHSEHRAEVTCAYCGKKFTKSNSKLEGSKSGLYFCCREHKDLAQRIESGDKFQTMRPDNYNGSITNYRIQAFRNYSHKCAVCGWDEDEDVLQVHHIDENRLNGQLDNLIILCPTCHQKLTIHKYKLVNRTEIVLNNN